MTGRNFTLATAALWKLGDRASVVIALLPEARRAAVSAHLDRQEESPPADRGARLRAFRTREQAKLDSMLGPGLVAVRVDPRVPAFLLDRMVTRHGSK